MRRSGSLTFRARMVHTWSDETPNEVTAEGLKACQLRLFFRTSLSRPSDLRAFRGVAPRLRSPEQPPSPPENTPPRARPNFLSPQRSRGTESQRPLPQNDKLSRVLSGADALACARGRPRWPVLPPGALPLPHHGRAPAGQGAPGPSPGQSPRRAPSLW